MFLRQFRGVLRSLRDISLVDCRYIQNIDLSKPIASAPCSCLARDGDFGVGTEEGHRARHSIPVRSAGRAVLEAGEAMTALLLAV
jgi:hypothetical protein